MKFTTALVGLLFSPAVFAQNYCVNPTLHDFTVYSIGNIDVQKSDYQGMTGAGGYILATRFQFNTNPKNCLAVAAGGDIGINSAAIIGNTEVRGMAGINNTGAQGDVVSGEAFINTSRVYGNLVTTKPAKVQYSGIDGHILRYNALNFRVNHPAIANELLSESAQLSYMASNNSVKKQNGDLIFALKPGSNVMTILNPEDLANAKRLVIMGDSSSRAIINIPGDSFILDHQDVVISQTVNPANITWNFYQATFLHLSHTLNGQVGMPGIVMAPKALVEFNEALITGALYGGEIVTSMQPDTTLNAGQVNLPPNAPAQPTPAPTPTPAPPAPKPY